MHNIEGLSYFHESYFEHPCRAATEKDVLDTDIRGVGWRTSLRRWWHNWFLLSSNDSRCRDYYTSSQALRLERVRQFRKHRGRIHPFSEFSNWWSYFILVISIANRVLFHQNTSIAFGQFNMYLLSIGMILECILLVDLIVIFKTGYLNMEKRIVVLDSKKCMMHHCSNKMFFCVASALPLQCIMMIKYYGTEECNYCTGNNFVCCIKVLGSFGLFRVFNVSNIWNIKRRTFTHTYYFKLSRILLLACVTMLQYLDFVESINLWVAFGNNEVDNSSVLHWTLNVKKNITVDPFSVALLQFFIVCKYLCSYRLLSFHWDSVFFLDALSSITAFIIASMFKFWAIVEWFAIVNRRKTRGDSRIKQEKLTTNLLLTKQISDNCSAKIEHYYNYILSSVKVIEKTNHLYKVLPTTILKEIKLHSHYSFLRRIPYFSEWPIKLVEELTLLLEEEIYLEKDVVAPKWEQGDGLMILEYGVLAVYSTVDVEVGHLIDGDYFGELSLVTDQEIRICNVIAVFPSKVLWLPKHAFREYMKRESNRFFEFRQKLIQKFSGDNRDKPSKKRSGQNLSGNQIPSSFNFQELLWSQNTLMDSKQELK